MIVTNNGELEKRIVDALLDGAAGSIAASERFLQARDAAGQTPAAWLYLDIEALRQPFDGKGPFVKKTDNPVGELLFGGALDAFQHTPYLTASVSLSDDRLALQAGVPMQKEWISQAPDIFF